MVRDEGSPAVTFEDVVLAYGDTVALRADHVAVSAGTITAVIGPNGSGKSTFLGAVSGLVEPRSGRLRVLGTTPSEARPRVAHVLQETATIGHLPLTVLEVVRMGRYPDLGLVRRFREEDHLAVRDAMTRLEVDSLRDRQLSELSAGQRQRVHVAQGLAQRADMLLLDEPATGLDIPSQERIRDAVRELAEEGRTVVYTTHDVSEAALADRVVLLAGHVVASGSPDEVLTPACLEDAYGRSIHVTDEGSVLLDDPHHRHDRAEHR